MGKLRGDGAPWGSVNPVIAAALPDTLDERNDKAYQLVVPTMEAIFGRRGEGWHTFRRGPRNTVFIKSGPGGGS
jgi:hypothetical protein